MLASLTAVRADDSTIALGMGGVRFAKSADIRMAAEDLRISPVKVDVRFAFVNDSAKDIDADVAFPLPDIDTGEFWAAPLGTVTNDPVNFVDFKVTSDGHPVAFTADQRAFMKGKDVTAIIKAAGVPINVSMGNINALDNASAAQKKMLAKAGLAQIDGDNTIPQWTIRTRFHWKQHFPAGKAVVIEHSYQPVTGGTFFGPDDITAKGSDDRFKKAFCMDEPTLARLHRILTAIANRPADDKHPSGSMLQIDTTEYVLSTGNNWKGPIGKFHLTLDKLKPENTLSLCWDGELKKTGPATFEFTRENYAPARDVRMVVLR
ncbi:MAG TPA: DUF4424 family protein [Rhizomicrobium sp.]|jgi:hypothetical protein